VPSTRCGLLFALFSALRELSFTFSTTKAQKDWVNEGTLGQSTNANKRYGRNRMTIRKNYDRVPKVVQMQILLASVGLFNFQVNFSVDA
jgi:hypothetical protein